MAQVTQWVSVGWKDGWMDGGPACLQSLCTGISCSLPAPQLDWEFMGGKWWSSLVQVLQGEGLCGEADIAVTIEPHGKWVPVSHQEPLSQVKLGAKYEQGPLDVFLHHPLAILYHHGVTVHQLQHLLQVVHTHDA